MTHERNPLLSAPTNSEKPTPVPGTPAKSRNWTSEEVASAVEHLKATMPNEWAELERLELSTGDLRGSEAAGRIFGRLSNLHPECEPREISQLEFAIRLVRLAELGLK
jgi:hypothetical protein